MLHWLEDRFKDGELYTNSICGTWCIKCFEDKKRVELWSFHGKGYFKDFETKSESVLNYRVIKGLNKNKVDKYAKQNMNKIID